MRFIILLSALMIATAINPEFVSNYLEEVKPLLNVIFLISLITDLIELIHKIFKQQ